ncbi:MAG: hypothetical protein LBH98_02760 [Chitinispirillales bacterium]|jgi:hypothetical protein|nr:hypothetical protein [Chitinispirillales bacterium]
MINPQTLKDIGREIITRCKKAGSEQMQHSAGCGMFANRDKQPLVYTDDRTLRRAVVEALKDIEFILERREKLIGGDRPSQGKISGVILHRLTKAKIFHLCEACLKCSSDNCKIKKFNVYFPLITALDYLNLKYIQVPVEIRKEIIYSIIYRHTNQETLGLVFDILLHYAQK